VTATEAPVPDLDRQRRELAELRAARRDLAAAVTRQIDFAVEHFGKTPHEAARAARDALPYDPAAQPADQVSWWELSHALESDSERGQALWGAIKAEAREELATGFRAARAVEPSAVNGRPYDRAQFGVILDALRTALEPRDGLEHLLVQQMAAAHELLLRWQARAVQRMDLEVWHGDADRRRQLEAMSPARRERHQAVEGWVPPRLSDAEAVEQAVALADRYQRGFLRLLKAFRDTRRVVGTLVVAGGQVNIGERQVNVARPAPSSAPRVRAAPRRRPAPARKRDAGGGAENPGSWTSSGSAPGGGESPSPRAPPRRAPRPGHRRRLPAPAPARPSPTRRWRSRTARSPRRWPTSSARSPSRPSPNPTIRPRGRRTIRRPRPVPGATTRGPPWPRPG
jgi:hypothetical protein